MRILLIFWESPGSDMLFVNQKRSFVFVFCLSQSWHTALTGLKAVARVIMQIVTNNCKNVKLLISGEKKKIRFVENLLLSTLYCYLYYSHCLFLFHMIVLAENEFNISLYCTGDKWRSIQKCEKTPHEA